ncbi:MAG TPA: bifunctional phosphoribosylaminoimidazolecarboxamide formyltransferase/IMP cyclohydrolase [Candidatus Lokiarchaeia archaeon]|nr:bifunctional phosphoribosylaminoimidazolecarboxamide formyltransferase/IMP cyclohydrolase [Candidatus Lokiarchaeia archaeon]
MGKIQRALISVFDKAGVVDFARQLKDEFGVEILSTGGTARSLQEAGVDIIQVSDYTGSPEMFDGRVKTLHPKIEGGILQRRDNPKDLEEAGQYDVPPIDLVVCNLYPFANIIAKSGTTFDEAIEMIDIGGPTMIRAAAKNWAHVAVIADPSQYDVVLQEMRDNDGEVTSETRARLAQQVFAMMALYDATVAQYLAAQQGQGVKFPEMLVKMYRNVQKCRYGENWDQDAAFYRDIAAPWSLAEPKVLQGKEISFNNFLDIDSCLQVLLDIGNAQPATVILKHTSPNGAAIDSESLLESCKRAFSCDPLSAFGGIWGFNQTVTRDIAEYIFEEKKVFVEVILAPSFEPDAKEIIEVKQNVRVIEFGDDIFNRRDEIYSLPEIRSVLGGVLVQDYDYKPVVKEWKVVSDRDVSDQEKEYLEFAYKMCKWAKSNSAVFVKPYDTGMYTIGIGAGQQSRVHVVKLAASKAQEFGHDLSGSYMGTDSFFPFPDGLEAAADVGCVAIMTPGGSNNDDAVIQAANDRGVALVHCGKRVFRH